MTTRYVRAPGQTFGVFMLRETLRDARLSYRARGILLRLLDNVDGFGMTSEDLAAEGREGRDAVRSALRELTIAGYLVKHPKLDGTRRFAGAEIWVYNTAQTAPGNGGPENPAPGNPAAGNPRAENQAHKSRKSTNTGKAAARRLADARRPGFGAAAVSAPTCTAADRVPTPENPLPARAAAAHQNNTLATNPSSTGNSRRRRRTDERTGVVYWYDDEPAEIAQLVATYGVEDVRAMSDEFRRCGHQPLVTPIDTALREKRSAQHDATVEQERHQRAHAPPEDRAVAAAKAEAAMAEYEAIWSKGGGA